MSIDTNIKNEWFIYNENDNKMTSLISLQKRIEDCETVNKNILSILEDINKKIENFVKENEDIKLQLQDIKTKVKNNETNCNLIRNENLKLINRILEAEISVERTTNILLRKNISFPFTKINL